MIWVLLALAGAIANAVYFIATKRLLERFDQNVLAAGGFLSAGALLLVLAWVRGIPPLGNELFVAIAATSILNVCATTLVMKALKTTDISLAIPMLSFTPAFLVGTSFLVLGEIPTFLGIAGICITVAGSYVLNLSGAGARLSDPLRAILHNRGSLLMLLVAFLYSVALNFDKMVVLNSDPVFGSALVFLVLGSSFFCIGQAAALHRNAAQVVPRGNSAGMPAGSGRDHLPGSPASRGDPGSLKSYPAGAPIFALIGIVLAAEAVTINLAFSAQIVPYVIAIKRMSIIVTVLYGTIIAGEGESLRRIAGAGLMVAGAVLIILSG